MRLTGKCLLMLGASVMTTPGVAQAADAPTASDASVGDIVVTARRVSESAQRTPVTITAFSSAQIETKVLQSVVDISRATPSLIAVASVTSPQGLQIVLRGQTQTDTAAFVPGSVGVYYGDVYIGGAQIAGGLLNLDDLERVEVLKGPQGTLYGRNVTAGVIKFVPVEPEASLKGRVTAGIGNFGKRSLGGMLNVPLSEDWALRVNGSIVDRAGYSRNVNFGGRDLEDDHHWNARAALKGQLAPGLSLLVEGWYGKAHDNGADIRTIAVDTTNANAMKNIMAALRIDGLTPAALVTLPSSSPTYAHALAQIPGLVTQYANAPRDQTVGVSNPNLQPGDTSKIYGGDITLTYDVSDAMTLKSVTAYSWADRNSSFVVGGGPWVPGFTTQVGSVSQVSEEVQATGKAINNRLSYATGFYYIRQKIVDARRDSSQFGSFPLYLGQFGAGITNGTYSDNFITNESYAFYGQASFELIPNLKVTGGLRYTHETFDTTTSQYTQAIPASAFGAAKPAICSTPTLSNVAGVVPIDQCRASAGTSVSNLSYLAGLDWQVTPDVLLYAKTARGFRGGGVNPFGTGGVNQILIPFRPETTTDYEIGFKAEFLDRRVRLNASYYHTDYKDIQRTVTTITNPGPPPTFGTGVRNAANAKIDGFEAELTAVPVNGLTLGATMAYTRPRYINYTIINQDRVLQDISDQPFQNVPKWTYTISGSYKMPTSFGAVTASADWSWRSRTNMFADDTSARSATGTHAPLDALYQDAYGLLNASLIADFDSKNISVRLWAKNIANKRYASNIQSLFNIGLGYTYAGYGPPRTYGADLTYRF